MFATFLLGLPHCRHVCHILSIIATLWLCLPNFDYDNCTVAMFAMFDYDCNTVAMFAIYFVWLPHYGNICHISRLQLQLWYNKEDSYNVIWKEAKLWLIDDRQTVKGGWVAIATRNRCIYWCLVFIQSSPSKPIFYV